MNQNLVQAYFDRIGFQGAAEPTLETLQMLHFLHPMAIAFENFDPLLKRPVKLDIDSLFQKLIEEKRGGYCYEHNLLLREVLLGLGFQVTCLAARVVWGRPEGEMSPRSHMLLRVDIDEEAFLVDVGFGGLVLTMPLRFEPNQPQQTPHERFRLQMVEEEWMLEAEVQQEWKPLYHFMLTKAELIDYEVANWYVSTHPNSRFVSHLLAARTDRTRRYALSDNLFSSYSMNGAVEKRWIIDPQELKRTISDQFGISLPNTQGVDELLLHIAGMPQKARDSK